MLKEPNIPGYFSPPQLNFLYEIVRKVQPKIGVEIGSWMGRSTYAIAKAIHETTGGKLICVDSWKQPIDAAYFERDGIRKLFEMFPSARPAYVNPDVDSMMDLFLVTLDRYPFMKDMIEIRRIDSREVDLSGDAIDFSFIDGDHTYAGVRNDIGKVLRGAAPRVTMAFHDYSEANYPGVVRAIEELRLSRKTEWLGQVESTVALRLL